MVEQAARSKESQVVIEMWADLGCPWCYVGKHRLQVAISQRPDAERFKIMMRSFELDPDAPQELERNEESFIRTHGGTAATSSGRSDRCKPWLARRGSRTLWTA